MSTQSNHRMVSALHLGIVGLLASLTPLLTVPPAHGQSAGDRRVIIEGSELLGFDLPNGPQQVVAPLVSPLDGLAFAPDGRLFGLLLSFPKLTPPPPFAVLYTIDSTGATVDPVYLWISPYETFFDMAFATDGGFFLLTRGFPPGDPPQEVQYLRHIEPDTGNVISATIVPDQVEALAPSATGLWLLGRERLLHFDPVTTQIHDTGLTFYLVGEILHADSDSSGALWVITEPVIVAPPTSSYHRLDPATGAHRQLPDGHLGPMAIERRCQPSNTARCLLGGRFRATVGWRDFADRRGDATVAAAGSTDSALFWFFDPSNWEILVKVIDGCAENGHYWVFAAGTTDVEHTLEVTDLVTGQVFSTTNPLGRASEAITATDAFPSCP